MKNFENTRIVIEEGNNKNRPSIFIISDGRVHSVTTTPDNNFYITDEGRIGERYDENGKWCGLT